MGAERLVLLAAAAGELATVESIDRVLSELSRERRDATWVKITDALLELRTDRRSGRMDRSAA